MCSPPRWEWLGKQGILAHAAQHPLTEFMRRMFTRIASFLAVRLGSGSCVGEEREHPTAKLAAMMATEIEQGNEVLEACAIEGLAAAKPRSRKGARCSARISQGAIRRARTRTKREGQRRSGGGAVLTPSSAGGRRKHSHKNQ